jgi:carboxypeptidase D
VANFVGCVGLPVSPLLLMLGVAQVEHSLTRGSFFQTQISPLYFDREDVKRAIHAPTNVNWTLCTDTFADVFPNGDASLPPAFTVLPNVIEKSKRSVIVHGLADFILIAEGARIVLQK